MVEKPIVKIFFLRDSAHKPEYMSEGSAGADLFACVDSEIVVPAGEYEKIPTGIAVEIPIGFEGEVRPRSGLAAKSGITVLNSPGTIDSDYRGEVCVILINHSNKNFPVKNGDRIAQLLIKPVVRARFENSDFLKKSERGESGFGSTGVN